MNDDFDAIFGARRQPQPSFTERYARDPGAATPPAETHVGSGPYKAYGFMPAGVGECCDVQRWLNGTEIPEGIEFHYRYLVRTTYVGEEQITLCLPDCLVVIEGGSKIRSS